MHIYVSIFFPSNQPKPQAFWLTINLNRKEKNLQLISNLALFSSLFSLHYDEAYFCKLGAMTTIKSSPEANALDGESATTRAGLARDPGTQAVHQRQRQSLHQHRQSPSGLKRAGISTWRHFHSYCFLSHPSHQLWDVLPHFLGHKCPKSRSHICLVHHMVHCPSNSRGSRCWSGNE